MKPGAPLALGLGALLVAALAPRAGAVRGHSLDLALGLTSLYDNNILQYSNAQISLFESGLEPERFSLQTRDDGVYSPYSVLDWDWDRGRGRHHELRFRWSGSFHQENSTADNRQWSASWRESFRRIGRLSLTWYSLQDYYLRQLHDEDARPVYAGLTRHRRAELDLHIGSVAWQVPVKRSARLGLEYQYEKRRYNPDFRERDSQVHQGQADLEWRRLPRRGNFDVLAGYRHSHARGEDGDEISGATPDDIDTSYHGFLAGVNGGFELWRGGRGRLGADLAYGLETRKFDSTRPLDKFHYKRDDVLNAFEVGLRSAYRPHWSARGFYRFETNHTKLGAIVTSTTEAGSYHDHQVGMALEWSGTLWRQGSRRAQPAEPNEGNEEP
jgi:hypothetical protein